MKPHQKKEFKFMWREVTGDLQNHQRRLLAPSQGLAKSMQVVSLLVTIAEASTSWNKHIP